MQIKLNGSVDIREGGEIIIASLELEELSEERECLIGGSHGGGGGQGGDKPTNPQNEVENGDSSLPSSLGVWNGLGGCSVGDAFAFARLGLTNVNGCLTVVTFGRIHRAFFESSRRELIVIGWELEIVVG